MFDGHLGDKLPVEHAALEDWDLEAQDADAMEQATGGGRRRRRQREAAIATGEVCIGGAMGCIVLARLAATADHGSGVPLDGGLEAVAIAGSGVEATEECCPLQVP